MLQEALTEQWGRKVRLAWKVRGERAAWLQMATNAQQSPRHRACRTGAYGIPLSGTGKSSGGARACAPYRECFDISHTQGEKAVASCVVFDQQGARKTDYRHFNVSPDQAGDDYAAIEEAVRRRYQRRLKEQGRLPDLLLIDGGKGQMQRAWDVMGELDLQGTMRVMGIGKGPSRRPGFEVLYLPDGREYTLAFAFCAAFAPASA